MSSFRKPIMVKRTSAGSYGTNGIWTEGAQATLTINMSVQPLKPNEMEALPEGRRNGRVVKIYSDVELYTAKQSTGQNADIVIWLGKNFEVIGCDPYQMEVISHYKSLAVEVNAN